MTAENRNIISAAIIVILATAVVDAMPGATQSVGLFNCNYAILIAASDGTYSRLNLA